MKTKKILQSMFLTAVPLFLFVENAFASGYQPLVNIPGLPTGTVDISGYLVGLYNFLLSIVGILAVIMLIIGGMKYITAAGSGGSVTAAKQTIMDALVGLGLALLSWVIVSAINPDVLYLRQPGAAFDSADIESTSPIDQCYSTASPCTCLNGDTPTNATNEAQCQDACEMGARCSAPNYNYCILAGSPQDINDLMYKQIAHCVCANTDWVTLPDQNTTCQQACVAQHKCGYKFLAVKVNASFQYAADGDSGEEKYILDSSRGDRLWEMEATDDHNWGDFAIGDVDAAQDDQGNSFPCGILVTNEQSAAIDDHFVYWVRDGVIVGGKDNLWDDINPNVIGGCNHDRDEYGIGFGLCDQASVERVMKAMYSDNVVDGCEACGLADTGRTGGKAYRFNRKLICRDGYWQ